jgi:hypothetical protein
MKLSRLAIRVALAILVVGAVGAGVASAHKKKIKAAVTIQWTANDDPYAIGDIFSGDVATKEKCREDRTVKVFRAQGVQPIGTDETNDRGHYRVQVTGPASPGDYFAKVKKKVLRKNKRHRHVCKKAISPTITVRPS